MRATAQAIVQAAAISRSLPSSGGGTSRCWLGMRLRLADGMPKAGGGAAVVGVP